MLRIWKRLEEIEERGTSIQAENNGVRTMMDTPKGTSNRRRITPPNSFVGYEHGVEPSIGEALLLPQGSLQQFQDRHVFMIDQCLV